MLVHPKSSFSGKKSCGKRDSLVLFAPRFVKLRTMQQLKCIVGGARPSRAQFDAPSRRILLFILTSGGQSGFGPRLYKPQQCVPAKNAPPAHELMNFRFSSFRVFRVFRGWRFVPPLRLRVSAVNSPSRWPRAARTNIFWKKRSHRWPVFIGFFEKITLGTKPNEPRTNPF
jgi:hypothetical protein